MKIRELIDRIDAKDLVIPEFQREYVWSKEFAKELMVSLYREYPIGSALLWETPNPPDSKGIGNKELRKAGSYQVVLDGQQRITTLYLLMTGKIPYYYREQDIHNDPRGLHFNLLTGDFQYYQKSKMLKDMTWVRVVDIFLGKIDPVSIAMGEDGAIERELLIKINDNHSKIKQTENIELPILKIPSKAGIDEAIDVFDRVNSKGTKVSEAELALAHITGKWSTARRKMKAFVDQLSAKGFAFDLGFMVRCLVAVIHHRGELAKIHKTERLELKDGWMKVEDALKYLIELLPSHAFVNGSEDLTTPFVLIPLVAILTKNGGTFRSREEITRSLHWFFLAQMWSRYSSSPNQRLDFDIGVVASYVPPYHKLEDAIKDQKGRTEVKSDDFDGRSIMQPFYRMAQVIMKSNGARDWFNGLPIDRTADRNYRVHSHHIFPTSKLYKEGGFSSDNHIDRKLVNEIANRVFITGHTNQSISDRLPEDYLPEVKERYPEALQAHCIPDNPELWKIENYKKFLIKRRSLLSKAINDFMESLVTDGTEPGEVNLAELLEKSESSTLEFKSTLRYDLRQENVNKQLEKTVARTIAGFLNKEGGILLIGVDDDGRPLGLKQDIGTLKKQNEDGFELQLREVIKKYLGEQPYIEVCFVTFNDRLICMVTVDRASEPVYLVADGKKLFYCRTGNSTRPLDVDEAHKYITQHWTI